MFCIFGPIWIIQVFVSTTLLKLQNYTIHFGPRLPKGGLSSRNSGMVHPYGLIYMFIDFKGSQFNLYLICSKVYCLLYEMDKLLYPFVLHVRMRNNSLQKLAHVIYIDFFSKAKIENFVGKILIFFLFLLKTLIVGTP